MFNTLLNKLGNVMPKLHLPGYNYCGPFTKLGKRLARVDDGMLDAKNTIYFTMIIEIKKKDVKNWKILLMKECMQVMQVWVKKLIQHY